MGRIKGWKKFRSAPTTYFHNDEPSPAVEILPEIDADNRRVWVVWTFDRFMQGASKGFKKKADAEAYAYQFMRSHPNG